MDITNFKNKKMHLILQFNRYLTKEKQSDYYASEDDLYISKNIVKKRNIAEYSNIIWVGSSTTKPRKYNSVKRKSPLQKLKTQTSIKK